MNGITLDADLLSGAPPEKLLQIIDVQNRIIEASPDFDRLLRVMVDSALALTKSTGAAIALPTEEGLVYQCVGGDMPSSMKGTRVRARGSLSSLALETRRALICRDIEVDERVDRETCRAIGIRSMITLPLIVGDEVLGVLKATSGRVDAFSNEDMIALESLHRFFSRTFSQAKLERSRSQQFATLANALPQLAWMSDATGYTYWYNERWYAYTGATEQEMMGWGWRSVHDPELLSAVTERWQKSIATRTAFEMIFPLRARDGRFRSFLTRITPVKDAQGNVINWFGTATDIEDQTIIERELRESRSRYASLVDAIPQLVWACASSGACTYLSKQWIDYTGIPECEQIGFAWIDRIVHPDDQMEVRQRWQDCVLGGHPYDVEYRIRNSRDEFRWFKARAAPVRSERGEIDHWVGTCTDVHDQKLAAQALILAKEQAEEANALKSAFLANMSHEIRTPLNVVLGFADLLGEEGIDSASRAEFIDRIRRNGQQLGRLINDILDLSKVESGLVDLESVRLDPVEIVREVIANLSDQAVAKGLELSMIKDAAVPPGIQADPTRMRQILINLVTNAIKFTPRGSVRIRVGATDSGVPGVSFTVEDTGIGVAAVARERLFRIFSQADNSTTRNYGGTGLGLALSRSLARAMGGEVRLLKSQVDLGSTFEFWIPEGEPSTT